MPDRILPPQVELHSKQATSVDKDVDDFSVSTPSAEDNATHALERKLMKPFN